MQSVEKRNRFNQMGTFVQICFNEQELHNEDEVFYKYDSTKIPLLAKRSEVIQAIIRIKYPDLDSEFAARINRGTDERLHQEWRIIAKGIADEFSDYIKDLLL